MMLETNAQQREREMIDRLLATLCPEHMGTASIRSHALHHLRRGGVLISNRRQQLLYFFRGKDAVAVALPLVVAGVGARP